MAEILLLIAVLGLSLLGTGLARNYALRRRMLDLPGERSSHQRPTPRGGGIALVLVFLATLPALAAAGLVPLALTGTLLLGGGAVALIGFLDDHHDVPATHRLGVHAGAAVLALVWIGLPEGLPWPIAWLAAPLAALGLVWLINLYNFMDGLDGLAGGELVSVSAGMALLLALQGHGGTALLLAVLAAAGLGFLRWNWPPARIFMGDVGSGFLGYCLGVIALSSLRQGEATLWPWLIAGAVFIVDASLTLARRMLSGAAWTQAHRSHAYQRAARRLGSHRPVTLAVLIINAGWLLPLAAVALAVPAAGPLLALLAWLPLLAAAAKLDAGKDSPAGHDGPAGRAAG